MNFSDRLYQNAIRTIQRRGGVEVTFTSAFTGDYDETVEPPPDAGQISIAGHAVEIPGDPEQYAAMELIRSSPITMIFVPEEQGALPLLGSSVLWAGKIRTVDAIFPIRPSGVGLAARLVLT